MSIDLNPKKLLTTKEAAQYLTAHGVSYKPSTLEVMRCEKRGLRYVKIVSRVYYPKEWLDEFLQGVPVKIFDPSKGA